MTMRNSFLVRTASKTLSSLINKKNKVKHQDEEEEKEEAALESWSELYTDLLMDIIGRVENNSKNWNQRRNVVACAGVCRRWRDVTKEIMSQRNGLVTFPSCLKQPGPRDPPQQCLVIRDKINSVFYLYQTLNASFSNKGKFLLAAKRCQHLGQTEYIISIDVNDISQRSNAYVGKLRSNVIGTSFTIYDSQPPQTAEKRSNKKCICGVARKQISPQVPAGNFEVGHVSYKFNMLKSRGPRRMACSVTYPWSDKRIHQNLEGNSLGKKSETSLNSCTVLSNKTPRWHEQLQCWCLNFHGRVTMASVKNFQLVAKVDQSQPECKGDEELVLLQFGKVASDTFTLEYRQPLSPFQAFAICLTSFGTKLACE